MSSVTTLKQTLVGFSNVLKDYQYSQLSEQPTDIENVVQEFKKISSREAEKSLLEPTDAENWELETKLWHLIAILLTFRSASQDEDALSDDMTIYDYNSDIVYWKKFLQNDKKLYEIWLIMVWVQENLKAPARPDNMSGSKWPNSSISGELASCDVDCPLRDNVLLEKTDEVNDEIAFKYIFDLLLCGKVEQAKRECELTENIALGMILCGIDEYCDPALDSQIEQADEASKTSPSGCEKKVLWRRAVYSLSQNPSLGKYERAIYQYLAGTPPTDSQEEITEYNWDSYLLLYLNQLWNVCIESYMNSIGKFPKDQIVSDIHESKTSIQTILNTVALKSGSESEHPTRVLMAAIIMDDVNSVIKSSVNELVNSVQALEQQSLFEKEPFLLRLLTHVIIVCDIYTPNIADNNDKTKLISSYITILNMYELYEAIPIYASFLDPDSLLESYSFILTTMTKRELKKAQLSICTALQLPTSNILKRLAQTVFDSTAKYYEISVGEETVVKSTVDSSDHKLINAADWLIEGHLYSEALDMIVAISRSFLLCGKTEALSALMQKIDVIALIKDLKLSALAESNENKVAPETNSKVKEVSEYNSLVEGLLLFKKWGSSSLLLNNQSNLPSLVGQFNEFSAHFYKLITNFLSELVSDDATLYQIRALYVPYLVMELHKSLMSASEALQITSFAHEAMNLSCVVADESNQIYLLFQSSGKLKEFLTLVAQSAIKVGIKQ
ncbi:hypothetical protein ACO0QE_001244 [Hanseniaspora vineae]